MGCTVMVKGIEMPGVVREKYEAFHAETDYDKQDELFEEYMEAEAKAIHAFGPWEVSMTYSTWMRICELADFELNPEDTEHACWIDLSIEKMLACLERREDRFYLYAEGTDARWTHHHANITKLLKKGLELGETTFYVA